MKDRLFITIGAAAVIVVATLIWLSNRHDVQQEVQQGAQRDEAGTAPDNPEARVFALQAESTPDKKVRVTMRSLPTSGPVVTIITQFDYDTDRLKMKTCTISPEIGEGTSSAKVLHLAEPVPGLVRAVVVGQLEELPAAANVLACDFAVRAGAPAGPTVVRVHGQVADTTFEDRSFAAEKTIVISN